MTTLAAVRPDEWNLPLLVHVAGAMVLVGALLAVIVSLVLSRKGDTAGMLRVAYRTLLFAVIPSYIVMRGAAQWVLDEEGVDEDATWVGLGFLASEPGLLLLIVATVLTGMAARRARGGDRSPDTLGRVSTGLLSLLLALYVVAIWAMTTKPD